MRNSNVALSAMCCCRSWMGRIFVVKSPFVFEAARFWCGWFCTWAGIPLFETVDIICFGFHHHRNSHSIRCRYNPDHICGLVALISLCSSDRQLSTRRSHVIGSKAYADGSPVRSQHFHFCGVYEGLRLSQGVCIIQS